MKDKIKIHFVCRGNVLRNRLAEAYAKSKFDDNYEISSSGIDSTQYPQIYVSPWTKILSHEYGLTQYLTDHTTQTDSNVLEKQNKIIFMSEDVHNNAISRYIFNDTKSIVWNVKDREDWSKALNLHNKRQKTYKKISQQVNELVHKRRPTKWMDRYL